MYGKSPYGVKCSVSSACNIHGSLPPVVPEPVPRCRRLGPQLDERRQIAFFGAFASSRRARAAIASRPFQTWKGPGTATKRLGSKWNGGRWRLEFAASIIANRVLCRASTGSSRAASREGSRPSAIGHACAGCAARVRERTLGSPDRRYAGARSQALKAPEWQTFSEQVQRKAAFILLRPRQTLKQG
jgi:hypothetical protein